MDKLADDVLQTTLDCIEDQALLHTLLFVSRRFYTYVEPRLYSSIEFIAKSQIALRPRFDGFQRRIASNSYLASRVKKFKIDLVLVDYKTAPEEISFLVDTLPYLVGLKDFRLKLCIPSDVSLTILTRAHCPFLLTKFVWQNPMARAQALVAFLENQPFIEHLHLVLAPTTINLSHEALPRLKELIVPSLMAMNILPGRKVTRLCLILNSANSCFDRTPSLAMEEALAHIEFLSCTTFRAAYLLPGVRLMHKLRWLQIMFSGQVKLLFRFSFPSASHRLIIGQHRYVGPSSNRKRPDHEFVLHTIGRLLYGVSERLDNPDPGFCTFGVPGRYRETTTFCIRSTLCRKAHIRGL